MAREMMFGEAMVTAIAEEMQRDSDVVFYGQNMAMTERDPMLKKFGKDRVRITPISETAELGAAVGAAITGLRPDRRAVYERVHARGVRSGAQRSAETSLHVRRAGESAGRLQSRASVSPPAGPVSIPIASTTR